MLMANVRVRREDQNKRWWSIHLNQDMLLQCAILHESEGNASARQHEVYGA